MWSCVMEKARETSSIKAILFQGLNRFIIKVGFKYDAYCVCTFFVCKVTQKKMVLKKPPVVEVVL